MLDILILSFAAFAGGMLNALAGGGSFLTLPALIYTGVPAVAANATGTFALLPGYFASVWGFRKDLGGPDCPSLIQLLVLATLGGGVGAVLLLVTPDTLFRSLVPWLLLAATALFAIGPWVIKRLGRHSVAGAALTTGVLLPTCIYGGYFNGGLGIFLLAVFALLGMRNLNTMNGLKNLVSAQLTVIAVGIYIYGGTIVWRETLIMMVAATAGGYAGARVAYRIAPGIMRIFIMAVGLVMAGLFFWF